MVKENVIREIIVEIETRNSDSVKFLYTPGDINNILNLFQRREYYKILYTYGYLFLLELMQSLEDREYYEECVIIKKDIDLHNSKLNDNIPTRL